jgi:hypothetical protein
VTIEVFKRNLSAYLVPVGRIAGVGRNCVVRWLGRELEQEGEHRDFQVAQALLMASARSSLTAGQCENVGVQGDRAGGNHGAPQGSAVYSVAARHRD